MADVFISYKREDRAIAVKLAVALERHTLSVWWDKTLQVGDDFRTEIATELDGASRNLATRMTYPKLPLGRESLV